MDHSVAINHVSKFWNPPSSWWMLMYRTVDFPFEHLGEAKDAFFFEFGSYLMLLISPKLENCLSAENIKKVYSTKYAKLKLQQYNNSKIVHRKNMTDYHILPHSVIHSTKSQAPTIFAASFISQNHHYLQYLYLVHFLQIITVNSSHLHSFSQDDHD